jgi:tetratricopeptide (TPR) repeat protein
MTKLRIAVGALAAVGVATVLLLERQAQARLRERNQALREQVEHLARLKAGSRPLSPLVLQSHLTSSLPGEQWRELLRLRGQLGVLRQEKAEVVRLRTDNSRMRSNWVEQLLGGKKLSLEQVASYLKANQRSAESLIAASHLTGDLSLLREAVEKYPNDPGVNFAACFALKDETDPADHRQRLEAFKQSAPDNALANYLSAQDYFKSGQQDQAVQELMAASGKPRFQDYYSGLVQSAEAAYQAAGLSTVEAALAASVQPLPQLAALKGLGQSLAELATLYRQAGDEASAGAALQMGVTLGRQLGEAAPQGTVISQFVGMAIERQILGTLDPASPYDAAGRSVQDRLDELLREREAIKALFQQGERLLRTLPEPALISYYNRMRTSGELEAMRWVVNREGHP